MAGRGPRGAAKSARERWRRRAECRRKGAGVRWPAKAVRSRAGARARTMASEGREVPRTGARANEGRARAEGRHKGARSMAEPCMAEPCSAAEGRTYDGRGRVMAKPCRAAKGRTYDGGAEWRRERRGRWPARAEWRRGRRRRKEGEDRVSPRRTRGPREHVSADGPNRPPRVRSSTSESREGPEGGRSRGGEKKGSCRGRAAGASKGQAEPRYVGARDERETSEVREARGS